MAKMVDQRIVVLALLLCLIAGSNSQAPPCNNANQQLENTVVYEGNSSSFFNQPDPSNVKWEIAPSFDPSSIPNPPYLVANDSITPYPEVYTVTPTQLLIPKASIYNQSSDPYSTSGLYTVTYKADGCQAMANLIVVSKGPDCLCTPNGQGAADLTCGMEYGVARMLPNYATVNWTTDSGNEVFYDKPTPNQDNPNYDVSKSTYQITSSGAASYTCEVTFTPPDSNWMPNMATNAPTFRASCTVANCVKTTTITSIDTTEVASATTRPAGTSPPTTEIATAAADAIPPTTEIETTTAGTFPPNTEIENTAAGTFPPTTEIETTAAGTVPPTTTTGVATTTGVCVDSPTCSSKWSDRRTFCPYVQEFRNDCPAFCNATGCV